MNYLAWVFLLIGLSSFTWGMLNLLDNPALDEAGPLTIAVNRGAVGIPLVVGVVGCLAAWLWWWSGRRVPRERDDGPAIG